MDIRLIAFDLDGTLLTSQKRMTHRSRTALERAARAGVALVPATGRIFRGIPEEVRALPFRYTICANGGRVFDAAEGRALCCAEIAPEEAGGVLTLLNALPGACGYYWGDRAWMEEKHYAQLEGCCANDPQLLRSLRELYTPVREPLQHIVEARVSLQKVQIYLRDPAAKQRIMAELRAAYPQFAISSSLPNNIEINSAQATKGNALGFLMAHLGLTRENCMAFGDGSNDVSMLQVAGIGVAMANGDAEAKAVADRIAPGNDEDGLAQVIEELLP